MRSQIALTVLVALFAAGCASTPEVGASDEVVEMPTSPETADLEPDGESASTVEPSDSKIEEDVAATDDPAEDAAGEVTVSIGDFFFDPDELSVAVGDTVTWTHDGDITHNVTARDGSFASDNLASGETFAHTFAAAGSFEYRCTLHGQMIATIEVS